MDIKALFISVIVPFHNGEETIGNCLDALAEQRLKPDEIILVDNRSTDRSSDIVQSFIRDHPNMNIRLLRESTPGASAARNKGAREARGRWLVFTDADCIADPAWLQDLEKEMGANSSIGALAGCIKPLRGGNIISRFLGMYTLPANTAIRIYREFSLIEGGFPSANFAVRKDVFSQIGGFDITIPIYGEDFDLCARIYNAGFAIKTLTNGIIRHIHRKDIKSLMKQSFGFGKSHALCLRRSVSGALLWTGPLTNFKRMSKGFRIWIDFNQADKKMFVAVVAGFFWSPLWIMALAYLLYLCLSISRRIQQSGAPVSIFELPIYSSLLVLKSASMTIGRLFGSIRYRVLCI